MSFERDFYEERRRKWRRSAFWRGFFVALLLAGVAAWLLVPGDLLPRGEHIARFDVSGVIADDPARDALFDEMAEADNVRALIVRIDSPGGTTTGAEALYVSIRRVAEVKPVVAVMGEVAASGGYIAALAADEIVARGNTLTGSIGVIMEYPDLTGLMDRIGIGMETVRSSELKSEPSPFRPSSDEARAIDEALVAEGYAWFRSLVGDRRNLNGSALDKVSDGRIFTGRMALGNGLVDRIGGQSAAIDYLESVDATLADLPVELWSVEADDDSFASIFGRISAPNGLLPRLTGKSGPRLYSIAR
ncbi:MAG: signal peptide peptidase SppA [Paracoccaceae bacterium]